MKIYAGIAALLFCAHLSFGQVALRMLNYRPTGEFGFVMKSLYSAEISAQGRFYDRWRPGISFSYLPMKPRLDVFPVVGVRYDGSGTTVLPGEQSFRKYNIYHLAAGYDFAFLHQKKFDFYVGLDIVCGAAIVEYREFYPLWIDEEYSGGGVFAGLRGRIGFEYYLSDRFSAFLNINREGFWIDEPRATLSANDYGLGARYTFDD